MPTPRLKELPHTSKKSNPIKPLFLGKSAKDQEKKLNSIRFLKEFTQTSTIHGVQHIFRQGETRLHRIIWTLFFSTCLSSSIYLIYDSWQGYLTMPVAVTVSNTNYPLDRVYFPAVTICPVNKLVNEKAILYLKKNTVAETVADPGITSFFQALRALKHPVYNDLGLHLENSKPILEKLVNVNITDLMVNSLPECDELFLECYWNGHKRNCCSFLSLQRTEEGFCYSFNSVTSEKNKHCAYKDAEIKEDNCNLVRTSYIGLRSGVTIVLKTDRKVMVHVHHPNEYPEAGMGTILPVGDLDKLNMAVKPTITESSEAIRDLPSHISGCYFKDRIEAGITKIYSQKTCLLECRMKHILRECGCLPYYITMKKLTVPCNSLQLQCILENTDNLRFYRPPSDDAKVSDIVKERYLDCTGCLPTCNERQYEVTLDLLKDAMKKSNSSALVDVFYRTTGAVMYQRGMTYDYVQLLVNLGGIGGLFLGGSVISMLEAVYWFSKALITYLKPTNIKIAQKKKHQSNDTHITIQGWVN